MLRSGAVDQDFGLSEEQREVVAAVRAFGQEQVAPATTGLEERGEFPHELFAALGEMGLAGVPYDERYGGAGLDWLTYMAVLEELAKASLPLAVTMSVHHLSAFGIHDFGSEELKERYLPRMLSGKWLGAYALSEASSGSDAASLRTRAEPAPDGGWRLTGAKRFITHAGDADVYVVMARSSREGPRGISAFVVEKGWPGFDFGKLEAKMAWAASPLRELPFDGCPGRAGELGGQGGAGLAGAAA